MNGLRINPSSKGVYAENFVLNCCPTSKTPQGIVIFKLSLDKLGIVKKCQCGGGGIRTHASLAAQGFSKPSQWTELCDSSVSTCLHYTNKRIQDHFCLPRHRYAPDKLNSGTLEDVSCRTHCGSCCKDIVEKKETKRIRD